MNDQLSALLSQGRICPRPRCWHRFWELLPRSPRKEAPVPLMLRAWHFTDVNEKRQRLKEQIEYAAREGALDGADAYCGALRPQDWSDGEQL
jgi:hypothetical protein